MGTLEVWASWSAIIQTVLTLVALIIAAYAYGQWKKQRLYKHLEEAVMELIFIEDRLNAIKNSTLTENALVSTEQLRYSLELISIALAKALLIASKSKKTQTKSKKLTKMIAEYLGSYQKFSPELKRIAQQYTGYNPSKRKEIICSELYEAINNEYTQSMKEPTIKLRDFVLKNYPK